MSTYGGQKRKQPVDRYFFTEESTANNTNRLRRSMHENDIATADHQRSFDADNSIYS